MLAQIPYSCWVMFLESKSVKKSPVAMLMICAVKIMKPVYWILIVFFAKCWPRKVTVREGRCVGAGSGTRTRAAPKGHWLSRPAH